MKFLNYKQKMRLMRISALREKQQKKRKKNRYKIKQKSKKLSLVDQHYIYAPAKFIVTGYDKGKKGFSGEKERNEFIEFIKEVNDIAQNKKEVSINFSDTELLFPCGTSWFLTEIQKLLSQGIVIKCVYPRNRIVRQLFQHVGFFKWLGLNDEIAITANNVEKWLYFSGKSPNDLSKLDPIAHELNKYLDKDVAYLLLGGIKEAIANITEHAYAKEESNKLWSVFFSAKNNGEILTLSVCDLGMGIPESLKEANKEESWGKKLFEEYIKILSFIKEGNFESRQIKAAVAIGATSTKLPNRGKGLNDMRKVVSQSRNGYLNILSNKGGYRAIKKKNNCTLDVTEYCANFKLPIKGTIIQWNFDSTTML